MNPHPPKKKIIILPSLPPFQLFSNQYCLHHWSVSLHAACKQKHHLLYILLKRTLVYVPVLSCTAFSRYFGCMASIEHFKTSSFGD